MFNEFDFDFPELEMGFKPDRLSKVNCIWPAIIAGGAMIGSSLIGAMSKDKDKGYPDPEVLPKTVSGQNKSDFDILYDSIAEGQMTELTKQLGDWASKDRDFFKNVYQPFQNDIINTNQQLLPTIEKVASASLEANAKALVTNTKLQDAFSKTAAEGFGDDSRVSEMADNFFTELKNMPSESEMVGQALTAVEGQFEQAGKELTREFASRGQAVSQASKRDLAFQKAQAKAGAAGVAKSGFRSESLQRAEAGLGAATGLAESEQSLKLGAAEGIIGLQDAATRIGESSMGMQVGGLGDVATGEGLADIQAGMTTKAAEKMQGTSTETEDIQHTQKGIKSAPIINADGSVIIGGQTLRSDEYNELLAQIRKSNRPTAQPVYQRRDWGGGPGMGAGGSGPGSGGSGASASGASSGQK